MGKKELKILTYPHSLILTFATCLMATRSPSLFLTPAYTIPNPPLPRTGPTLYSFSKGSREGRNIFPDVWNKKGIFRGRQNNNISRLTHLEGERSYQWGLKYFFVQNIFACLDVGAHLHVLKLRRKLSELSTCVHITHWPCGGPAWWMPSLARFLHHPEYMDHLLRSWVE